MQETTYSRGLTITLYFEDREPMRLAPQCCQARRNVHIRMDEAKTADGSGVPMDTPYAAVVEATQPVAVQYSRADARQRAGDHDDHCAAHRLRKSRKHNAARQNAGPQP